MQVAAQSVWTPDIRGSLRHGGRAHQISARKTRVGPHSANGSPPRIAFGPALEGVRRNGVDAAGGDDQPTDPAWDGQRQALGKQTAIGESQDIDDAKS